MTTPACPKCGKDMVDVCPICHEPVDTYSRVVGYLRPVSTWNPGKQQEFAERTEYIIERKREQLLGDHPEERSE